MGEENDSIQFSVKFNPVIVPFTIVENVFVWTRILYTLPLGTADISVGQFEFELEFRSN